jgi:hypothetical protein
MGRRTPRRAHVALLGLGIFLAGCAPGGGGIRYPESGATLEGTVSYGTDRVAAALVIAQGGTGAATAFVDSEGRYKLENVPLGEVNLAVNTAAGKGQAMGRLMAESQGKAKGAPRIVDVPGKYADPAKSGIKTTINKGANTFDIVIPK